jgi:predicted enzyme related to lactoylglutathione lyase
MTPTTSQVSSDKTGSATPTVPLGRFVWYELLANDQAVATAFYTKVLGWATETWKTPPGASPYTMWNNAGKPFGGLMDLPTEARKAGAPSHWLGYVTVPDTDASLAQAKKLGAKALMDPMDIPEVGRLAVIADPQGAAIALFTPSMTGGELPASPAVGNVSWHELATDDGKKAWGFYQTMFGWQKGEAMDMGAEGTYQIFTLGGPPVGAIYNRPPQIPVSNWLYYFRVANLDEAIEKTKAGGGKVLNGPMDVPGGRIAQCMDPQGAAFALHWIKEG